MTQKLIQIGNSTGIIIPKVLLETLGLKPGSEVNVETDKNTRSLIIQIKGVSLKSTSINTHFLKILDKVNNEYGRALQELAEK